MIQVHRSQKDSVQFIIIPILEMVDFLAMGFFPLTVLGSFQEGSSVQGAVGSILAEFSESKKPQGTGLPHSFTTLRCFLFGEKLLLRGKVGEILLFPPGCL
jgi:hypothetical protein